MPRSQSSPYKTRPARSRATRNANNASKKKGKRRSTVKGGKKNVEPAPAPFSVWPEYPTGPVTCEEMQEIDLRQKAYIAYHGSSPWSPENLWGPDEDSSLEESDSCEDSIEGDCEEKERDAVSDHCPESLEDGDILRAM